MAALSKAELVTVRLNYQTDWDSNIWQKSKMSCSVCLHFSTPGPQAELPALRDCQNLLHLIRSLSLDWFKEVGGQFRYNTDRIRRCFCLTLVELLQQILDFPETNTKKEKIPNLFFYF